MDVVSFRKSRGLSQAEFAAALGLRSKSYVSELERGRQKYPLKLALKIEQLSDGAVPAASLCPDAAELLAGEGAG